MRKIHVSLRQTHVQHGSLLPPLIVSLVVNITITSAVFCSRCLVSFGDGQQLLNDAEQDVSGDRLDHHLVSPCVQEVALVLIQGITCKRGKRKRDVETSSQAEASEDADASSYMLENRLQGVFGHLPPAHL